MAKPNLPDDRSRKAAGVPPDANTVPPRPPPSQTVARAERVPAAPPSGAGRQVPQIPGYEILGELGRGGMGVVYKARQTKLKRVVALKVVLAGGHASAAELARFRTEAEAVARLRHPGIVQIYDVGEHNGLPYFSLEYCAGGSLAERLRSGSPPRPKQAARLVEQLARAVHEAHEQNIIHRDLKPANILLTEATDKQRPFGKPKITDFGLARRLDSATRQTQTGHVMGTPSYMSPEQAEGSSRSIGPATDIYALGAILYELLTGGPPFAGATPLDIIMQVIGAEPAPPRPRRRGVPRDLEVICLKCLRKDPAQRYATAAELAEDLRSYLDGEGIAARPVGSLERAARWAVRNAILAGLGAAIVALTLGLAVLGGKYRGVEQQRLRLAERARHLEQLIAEKPVTLKGHSGPVLGVAFSADGRRLASAGLREVELWDPGTGQEVLLIRAQREPVTSLAYSPDGKRLASGGQGVFDAAALAVKSQVKVWDAATGRQLFALGGHAGGTTCLAYSPDGTRLAAAGRGKFEAGDAASKGELMVWDAATGQQLVGPLALAKSVNGLAYSPDGKRLASAGQDGAVRIWDAATGQEVLSIPAHNESATAVAYSPDGKRLATGSSDWTVKVWDAATGRQLLACRGHMQPVTSVAYSPDGRHLASGSLGRVDHLAHGLRLPWPVDLEEPVDVGNQPGKGGEVKVWDAATGEEALTLKGHTGGVTGVAFSADGKRLASASYDRTVKLWDIVLGSN